MIACILCLAIQFANAAEPAPELPTPQGESFDVVVYGGTSGGIVASIQAAQMGKSVLLIEPTKHLGGLTSGGLGATDIGNKQAIGGLSRSFYERLGKHYQTKIAWKFEPHVAELTYRHMLSEAGVPVLFGQRLNRETGVKIKDAKLTAIVMESGKTIRGKVFLDTTYEGDLMASAGVAFHVGRESNDTYGETLNGVQVQNAIKHQFEHSVDPYRIPGDSSSGLLPGIEPQPPAADGTGDHKIQAYCFRMCTTDVKENQRPWVKPDNYDPIEYELLLRNFEAGDRRVPWNPVFMPNRKTDTNNNFAISTDYIGHNYEYPNASYETRERIFQEHLTYQQGLMWTLANSPRVPAEVKEHFHRLQLTKDEFVETDGWPHQLYVREARRMISEYVMTQHDCQGKRTASDPVGLAAYTMDSHNIQRYVKDGRVLNEGDVQVGGFAPYPISYRSIRPRKSECENLLVPMCLAASHIAYGSIRMEPVFMVLGQSAATAACFAIDDGVAVQDVEYAKLKAKLLEDKQVLEWTGPRPKPTIDPGSLPGIVIDDLQARRVGHWSHSQSFGGYIGPNYAHDLNVLKGEKKIIFEPRDIEPGEYEIRFYFIPHANRASNTPVKITVGKKSQSLKIDQRSKLKSKTFVSLGTVQVTSTEKPSVEISNAGTDGYVVVDVVQFLPKAGN